MAVDITVYTPTTMEELYDMLINEIVTKGVGDLIESVGTPTLVGESWRRFGNLKGNEVELLFIHYSSYPMVMFKVKVIDSDTSPDYFELYYFYLDDLANGDYKFVFYSGENTWGWLLNNASSRLVFSYLKTAQGEWVTHCDTSFATSLFYNVFFGDWSTPTGSSLFRYLINIATIPPDSDGNIRALPTVIYNEVTGQYAGELNHFIHLYMSAPYMSALSANKLLEDGRGAYYIKLNISTILRIT